MEYQYIHVKTNLDLLLHIRYLQDLKLTLVKSAIQALQF